VVSYSRETKKESLLALTPGHLVPVNVCPPDSAEAGDGPVFRVVRVLVFGGGLGHGGAVVDQNADVDAHDGNDATDVEVHHEDTLKQSVQYYFFVR